MNKKCPNCNLINFLEAENCRRCEFDLKSYPMKQVTTENQPKSVKTKIIWRVVSCMVVLLFSILGFYLSLIFTSAPLQFNEKQKVNAAIQVLETKGFSQEAFLLNYLAAIRSNDNWLNASVEKENAYAATNFPFEIMTVYPDFFTYPLDDVERAAVLLHEAQHLKGADEKSAYEFVWRNRKKLGWTKETYGNSKLWQAVKKQTKEYSPNLFICQDGDLGDCTDY
ncbi:MAG: hypothetical protein K1X72_16085 [Pyrinomonadaceae bacterium]|nr:hypothetical protein [Pyrinomonadaceae bacterium]